MAQVNDRVDLLVYLASDTRPRDPSANTLVVRLPEAAAQYLRETLPGVAGQRHAAERGVARIRGFR